MPDLTWFKDSIQQFLPTIALSSEQHSALYKHFELLTRWNQRMDLTSVDTAEEIVSRHYCESLFFAEHLPGINETDQQVSVVDFGSGAGFPGVPLAVLRPTWRITLLEANSRRAVFLKEAARGITNIRVIAKRGEEYAEKHDWVVARAVKATDVLESVPRLGNHIGLLVGEASIGSLQGKSNCRWAEPVRISGSSARFCLFGECST